MAIVGNWFDRDFIGKQVGDWYLIRKVAPYTMLAKYTPSGKNYKVGHDVIRENKAPWVSPNSVKGSLFD